MQHFGSIPNKWILPSPGRSPVSPVDSPKMCINEVKFIAKVLRVCKNALSVCKTSYAHTSTRIDLSSEKTRYKLQFFRFSKNQPFTVTHLELCLDLPIRRKIFMLGKQKQYPRNTLATIVTSYVSLFRPHCWFYTFTLLVNLYPVQSCRLIERFVSK